MYNNPYIQGYNPQASVDRINAQIAELEKMKQSIPMQQTMQPTNLTQNIQIAPANRDVIKYANSIDEVQRDMVIGDTPYFSKDMSVVWIKNAKGEIKTYELSEIVVKDEKDLQIELLQAQINELKKEMNNNERINTNANEEQNATNTSANDGAIGTTTKKSESSSVSRISTSKAK